MNININNRYGHLVTENKETNKNEIGIIEEENPDNNYQKIKNRKVKKLMTKSLDKVNLPNISSNNINNNSIHLKINEEKNTLNNIRLNKSNDFKSKIKETKKSFPKINSLYYNRLLQENEKDKEQIETQSRFKEDTAIKIYNGFKSVKKNKNFPKMIQLTTDNKNEQKIEEIRNIRKPDRLKSIFEKEKQIKNNNLFLGEKNNYTNSKEREVLNDEMAHQIHNLKKQLLGTNVKIIKKIS